MGGKFKDCKYTTTCLVEMFDFSYRKLRECKTEHMKPFIIQYIQLS